MSFIPIFDLRQKCYQNFDSDTNYRSKMIRKKINPGLFPAEMQANQKGKRKHVNID